MKKILSSLRLLLVAPLFLVAVAATAQAPQPPEVAARAYLLMDVTANQILAQKDANPTVVSLLLSLESVFSVVAGAVILHDRLTGRELLGCGLMLLAVVLAQLPARNGIAKAQKA